MGIKERLLKNVNDFIKIRKIAQYEGINYDLAKIIYQCDYSIDEKYAIAVRDIAKYYKVPNTIILDTIKNYGSVVYYHQVAETLDEQLGNSITQRIGEPNKYAWSIVNTSNKLHIPLEPAKKITDLKIKLYAKLHKTSLEEATLITTYGYQRKTAKNILKATDYLNKNGIIPEKTTDLRLIQYLENSDDINRKIVNGIKIAATSEENLNIIEEIILNAYQKGDAKYLEQLKNKASERELLITDFKVAKTSCYFPEDMIFLNKDDIKDKNIDRQTRVFFHETSHFLDFNKNKNNYYSLEEEDIGNKFNSMNNYLFHKTFDKLLDKLKLSDEIETKISSFLMRHNAHANIKGIKMMLYGKKGLAKEYIENEELRTKWKNEIEKENQDCSQKDKELLFEQKIYYEKQKYIKLMGSLSDIYDAMAKGKLRDFWGLSGHGKTYFKNPGSDLIEYIADIGAIINSGGEDILVHEFGESFAQDFKKMYYDMIEYNHDQKQPSIEPTPNQENQISEHDSQLHDMVYGEEETLTEKKTELEEMLEEENINNKKTII